jgi:hypothetical protein
MFVTISGAEDELRDAVAAATARLPVEEPGPHARPLPTASKCFAEWRSTLPWFAGETLRNFLSLGENERGSMVYDILCAEAWRTPAARALFDVGVLRWRLPIPVERMPWVLQDNPSPDKWPAMHVCIVRNTSVPLHKVMSPLVQVASGDAYAYSGEADVGAAFWESVRYGQAGLLRRMLMVDLLTMTPDDVNEVYVAVGAALAGAPGFVPQAYRAIMRTGGTTLDQATRVAMMALRQCGMAAGLRPWSSMVEHCVAQCGATNAGWTSGIICLMLAPLLACSTANHVWHLGGPRSGGKSTIIAMMGDMLEAAKTVSAAGTPLAMIYDGQVLDNGEQRVHTGTGCMVPCDEDGPTTSSDRRASNLWKTAITEECVSRKHTAEAADGSRKAITSLNGIWGASICVTSNQPSAPDLNTRVDVIQFHDSVPRGSGQLTMSRPTLQAMASIHESVRRILLPAVATAGALCADTALVKAAVTAADAGAVPRVHTRGEEIARCVATVNLAVLVVLHFKPSAWRMSDLAMLLLLEPPQPHDAVLLDNIAPSCDGAAFAQSIGHHLAAVVVPVSTGRLQYAAFNGDCQTLTAQQQRVLPGIFASVDHLTRERTPRELGQRMLASGVLTVTADDIASANIRYVAASVPRERVRLAVVLAGQLLDLVHSVPSAFVLVDKTVLVLSTEWLRAMSLCADDETTTALKELMKRRQLSAALRQMHANFHAGFWVSLVHMGMCVAGITHETDDVPDNVVQAVGAPRARQNFGGRLGEGDHCLFKPTSLSSAAWIDMRQLEKATHQYNYNTPPMVAVLQNTPTLVPAYDVSLAGHVHHIVPRPLRGRAVIDKRLPRAEVPVVAHQAYFNRVCVHPRCRWLRIASRRTLFPACRRALCLRLCDCAQRGRRTCAA